MDRTRHANHDSDPSADLRSGILDQPVREWKPPLSAANAIPLGQKLPSRSAHTPPRRPPLAGNIDSHAYQSVLGPVARKERRYATSYPRHHLRSSANRRSASPPRSLSDRYVPAHTAERPLRPVTDRPPLTGRPRSRTYDRYEYEGAHSFGTESRGYRRSNLENQSLRFGPHDSFHTPPSGNLQTLRGHDHRHSDRRPDDSGRQPPRHTPEGDIPVLNDAYCSSEIITNSSKLLDSEGQTWTPSAGLRDLNASPKLLATSGVDTKAQTMTTSSSQRSPTNPELEAAQSLPETVTSDEADSLRLDVALPSCSPLARKSPKPSFSPNNRHPDPPALPQSKPPIFFGIPRYGLFLIPKPQPPQEPLFLPSSSPPEPDDSTAKFVREFQDQEDDPLFLPSSSPAEGL